MNHHLNYYMTRHNQHGSNRYFPLLPFVAGLAVSPFLFGGFGQNNYYGPHYGPVYGPSYGPSYGPNFGPNYGPHYGLNYGTPYYGGYGSYYRA